MRHSQVHTPQSVAGWLTGHLVNGIMTELVNWPLTGCAGLVCLVTQLTGEGRSLACRSAVGGYFGLLIC